MLIAVVDDDKTFISKIRTALKAVITEEDSLIPFSNGMGLLNHLDTKTYPFDLVLLDVEMPHVNGIAVGKEIREHAPETAIVYVTSHEEYSLQAITTRPLDYLLKGKYVDRLQEIVDEVRHRSRKQDYFFVRFYGSAAMLPLGGIRYMESQGRKIVVYYGNSDYSSYYKIENAEQELADKGFLRVHRAYLVNTLHIVAVDRPRSMLTVTGGTIIPVSPRKIKGLYEMFCRQRMGLS